MLPINQLSSGGYSEEIVAKLTKAFNEVWVMLYAQVPPEDADVMQLSIDLSRALVDLAAEGITPRNSGAERCRT